MAEQQSAAVAVVDDLEASLALSTWPDPVRVWWGSVNVDRPGARLHESDSCPDLRKLRTVRSVTLAYSSATGRICDKCSDLDHQSNDVLAAACAAATRPWLVTLREAAEAVDATGVLPERLAPRLARPPFRCIGPGLMWLSGHAEKMVRAATAVRNIAAAAVAADQRAAHARHCAAQLLPVSERGPGMPVQTTHAMPVVRAHTPVDRICPDVAVGGAWVVFQNELRAGATVAAAVQAAENAITVKAPRLEHLRGIRVTGRPDVGIDDLVAAWEPQAAAQAKALVADWGTRLEELLTLSDQAGDVSVLIYDSARTGDGFKDGLYPATAHGPGMVITVPAVVAASWTVVGHAGELLPSEASPAEYLRVAAALVKEGMSTLAALATARVIVAPEH